MKKFMDEFKAFAMRGNVLDMAVGVVIGGAFGKITTSLVNDIIMPVVSVLTNGIDFSQWKLVLQEAVVTAAGEVQTPEVAINFGNLIAVVLDFLIIAFVIFCMIKAINRLHRKAEEPAPEPEDLLPQVVSPLDGTTVTVFSTTELMYDETMADWRTHNGLDIQAAEGDAVKTAASGMVVSIKSDELMGTTVVIEHAGGYTTQYSCLQAEPPVTEGQQVAAGDIIGLVGSTAAAESSMGPHLHFSVAKDGVIIDPSEYIG